MTKYQIIFAKPARKDLREIKNYISLINPIVADKILNDINNHIKDTIPNNPKIGRLGKVLRTREYVLTKYPYIIVYQTLDDKLLILRILHSSRQYP